MCIRDRIKPQDKIGVVAQTTILFSTFQKAVSSILKVAKQMKVYNTICEASTRRQQAAVELAQRVDLMLVIGGRNSGNTNRLAEMCATSGKPTYHIETYRELKKQWFKGKQKVGITAGASTPDWIIKEVVDKLKEC